MSQPLAIDSASHSGLIRMNDFAALATWGGGDTRSVVVKFNNETLTPEHREQLVQFRRGNRRVELELPGGVNGEAIMVGFGEKENAFFFTWI